MTQTVYASPLDHPWTYICTGCWHTWQWKYHELMQAAKTNALPCGCSLTQHLEMAGQANATARQGEHA